MSPIPLTLEPDMEVAEARIPPHDQIRTYTASNQPPPTPQSPQTTQPLGNTRRIVLTGFMGAGKSTVGSLLAQHLGWRFIDVDHEIETKAGMSVADIFHTLGEFVFRRLETSAIAHALGERNTILALGGGAPEVLANRLLLEQTPHTAVVFLEAPLPTLLDRCAAQQNAAIRPVLQDVTAAEERFRYRAPLYRRCARYRLSTVDQTPAQTAETLLALLTAGPATL